MVRQFQTAATTAIGALAIIRLMFDTVDSVTSRISHTTIDSRNAYQQLVWWSHVLSMREDPDDPNEPGHEECMIFSTDGRTRLLFIEVPEGKRSRIASILIFGQLMQRVKRRFRG